MYHQVVSNPMLTYARPSAPFRSRVSLPHAFSSKLDDALTNQTKAEQGQSPLIMRSALSAGGTGSGGRSYAAGVDASGQVLDWGRSSGAEQAYLASRTRYARGQGGGAGGVSGVTATTPDYRTEYSYQLEQVGETARAPMAMFEHDGNLVMSVISRSGISETPVYSYSEQTGVVKRGRLPEQAESGHYGFSDGETYHLVPESEGGMVDYTATSLDGPWTKHDLTYLNPHDYTNLKWGFGYQSPATGQQFLGYGLSEHPGVVLTLENGEWRTFAAADDMRFPTGIGVITSGENQGTTLISSSFGDTRLHAVTPDGKVTNIKQFEGWGVLRTDDNLGVAYVTTDQGRVYWSAYDDLANWRECAYQTAGGASLDKLSGFGEPNIHPQTGRMIFPAMDGDAGDTTLYEARPGKGGIVLKEVARLEGVGQWAGKSAVVGDDLFYGSGVTTGQDADRTSGAIFRINATPVV